MKKPSSRNKKPIKKPKKKDIKKPIKKVSRKKAKKSNSIFADLSAKKQEIRYRDKKGKLVDPKKINGRKFIKWEIWRYSENTKTWKKLEFGSRWKPKYIKRKRPMTATQFELACRRRYGAHHLEVRRIDGEVFAYTASP